jgi:uncharacterized membrane protein
MTLDRDVTASTARTTRTPPAAWPSLVLGIGLGGLADGIVLHQLLQWHHMATATGDHPADTVPGLQDNIFFDGLFHAGAWIFVVAGVIGLIDQWRRGRRSSGWGFHFGLILLGWGLFNLVEGLVNHQLLGIHHVRDDLGGPLSWDIGFLVVSAVIALTGFLLYRAGRRSQDVDLRG